MSLTILEVLQNAEYNIRKPAMQMQVQMGLNQLKNAIILLDSGKKCNDDFSEDELEKAKKETEIEFI